MPYSLYFHIPFCIHRCAYCDFNTYAGKEYLIPAYVEALCNEVRHVAACASERIPVHTIFFGGGTPSLLTTAQFEQILQTVRDHFALFPSARSGSSCASGSSITSETSSPSTTPDALELSLEANPGTVTLASLRGLGRLGFNRISFGVQSFHPGELHQLERIHDPFDVLNAVHWAHQAGFENLNLDLIYGLPEQSLVRWQANVKHAVDLAPQHLSLYALSIEPGTPYGHWADRGLLPLSDPDLAADMYEWASEYLEGQGYGQYEISNWARPGFQCRHNLQYWRNQPYLGFGAGAHGCANGLRISNVLRIKKYLARLSHDSPIPDYPIPDHPFPLSPATVTQTRLSPYAEMQDTMLLGLRLTHEGVSTQAFQKRFGKEMKNVFGKEIDELVKLGLLEWVHSPTSKVLRLTRRGRLVGNQVFLRFVD